MRVHIYNEELQELEKQKEFDTSLYSFGFF